MISIADLAASLGGRYQELVQVAPTLWKGVDLYQGAPYAVRYFETGDDLQSIASGLRIYQERAFGASYFDPSAKADLRWNHYVYFLVSGEASADPKLATVKATIESDREYARKLVVTLDQLRLLLRPPLTIRVGPERPVDPLADWLRTLEKHDLAFVVDEAIQVPTVARHIARGERRGVARLPEAPVLSKGETSAAGDRIASLRIEEFRSYPAQRSFEFGAVNLIHGVNGVGKTSLLEAIEYLYCGQNRRPSPAPKRAAVAAVLKQSKTEISTSHRTPPAVLRARHLMWYGKADLRAVKLDESFGKFNFLDTDAAVRLTVEQSHEMLEADLAQLLLGAEAAKALARFERLDRSLVDLIKDIERDIAVRDVRRRDAVKRLEVARDRPRESEALWSLLQSSLRDAGWISAQADALESAELASAIHKALVNIGIVKGAGGRPSARKAGAMLATLADCESSLRQLRLEQEQAAATERKIQVEDRRLSQAASALDELSGMVDSRVFELQAELDVRARRLETLLKRAPSFAGPVPASLIDAEQLLRLPIGEADALIRSELVSRDQQIAEAARRLRVLDGARLTLKKLSSQLRTVAKQIVEHSGDRDHCPLCATRFAWNDLQAILNRRDLLGVDDEAESLRAEVANLEHARAHARLQADSIAELAKHPATLDRGSTVIDALARITAEENERSALVFEVAELRRRAAEFAARGWTSDRLAALMRDGGVSSGVVTRAKVSGRVLEVEAQRAELVRRREELEVIQRKIAEGLQAVADDAGVPNGSAINMEAALASRAGECAEVHRAVRELDSVVAMSDGREAALEASLRAAGELASRWQTASVAESRLTAEIREAEEIVEVESAELDGLRRQARRANAAKSVIEELMLRQSGKALTAQVMKENGDQIAGIFAKIHAPSEFEVVIDEDGFNVVRRSTNERVGLTEMSSGQRAAFAMSLFLSMNERVKTGPQVIMFDDPVAHVDDINTLSFLDHLRDLVLDSGRQLFFATADSRLAALFTRKFRFLGQEFCRVDLARGES